LQGYRLNIYIYGNQSFKKEIHETLEHSNIKFKLSDNCLIKEIEDLSELKQAIQNNPKDIYLIDDEKIIKKNSLNKKIKFLIPKDAIEEEFLLDSGIADLSINSLKEIPRYILQKYEDEKKNEPQDDIQDSIIDIVDDAYEKENSVEIDDELAQFLVKEEPIEKEIIAKDNFTEEEDFGDLFDMGRDINLGESSDILDSLDNSDKENIKDKSKNEFDDIMNFNDNFGLNNISFDYDDKEIESDFEKFTSEDLSNEEDDDNEVFDDVDFLDEIFGPKKENKPKIEKEEKSIEEIQVEETPKEEKSNENENINVSLQGDNMNNDEFFELDSLNEKDLLEALNYSETNEVKSTQIVTPKVSEKSSNSINVTSSSNVDELAQLISKLLNNKTLEITIKIKD
jgi:hypothetical protein